MTSPALTRTKDIPVRALLMGERIDTRALERTGDLARHPLAVRTGVDGVAVIFREGSVVLFNVQPIEEVTFLEGLKTLVRSPFEAPQTEETSLVIDSHAPEGVTAKGGIRLADARVERLQLVADILAKSLILDYHETRIAGSFDKVEPVAQRLGRRGLFGDENMRGLLSQIGDLLLMQHKMVGRVEVTEKPELLWDLPELERLFTRLTEEYELADRDRALNRKLSVIGQTVNTALHLQENNRSMRVEWYIVILILAEIVLSLYEMFVRH